MQFSCIWTLNVLEAALYFNLIKYQYFFNVYKYCVMREYFVKRGNLERGTPIPTLASRVPIPTLVPLEILKPPRHLWTGTKAAYRIYSNKRRGVYSIFCSAERRLFEGGVYCKVYSNSTVALIKELPRRKRWQQTIREGHWKKEDRSWTSCTGKILGFHYGTARSWSFGERDK